MFGKGYSGAINACTLGGEWNVALHLLDEMSHVKVEQDTISYNSVISSCVGPKNH